MATGSPISLSGGKQFKSCSLSPTTSGACSMTQSLKMPKNARSHTKRDLSVRAHYNDQRGGSGADFAAGFLLGGAVFGTLAYIFSPQIRRSLLNEDEYGFSRAKRPIDYDEGLEKTRETLNEKINQLNSAIDSVSSRLRGAKLAQVPIDTDVEEASLRGKPTK